MGIEIITVVITHIGVTVTAVGDTTVREEYKPDAEGVLKHVSGNFGDEPSVNQNRDLQDALVYITDGAEDVFDALIKGA